MFRKSTSAPPKEPSPEATTKKKAAAKKKPKSAVEKVIEGDFMKKLGKHKDVREAFDGVIHLDVTGAGGGQWTADLTKSSEWITKGHAGKPKLTIRAGAKDFIALVKGEKNAQMAVMSGDLSLEPMDLDLAMKLGPLFS
jgi:putative sterol carrier protein